MSSMAGRISMGARREVVSAVTERYRSAKRAEKGRMLNAVLRALDEAVMAASMKFINPRPSPIRRRAQADGKR
jgi:hypothetical protein